MALRDFFYNELKRRQGLDVMSEGNPVETTPVQGGVSILAQSPILQQQQKKKTFNPMEYAVTNSGASDLLREGMENQIAEQNEYEEQMRRRRMSALYSLFNVGE